jgi:PAS domain S-box-containing protein
VLCVCGDTAVTERIESDFEHRDSTVSVRSVSTPAEGLETLDETTVGVIVSGYDLPGRDGIEFLEAVRKAGSDVAFVLFAEEGSEAVASAAISAGVSEYVRVGDDADRDEQPATDIVEAVDGQIDAGQDARSGRQTGKAADGDHRFQALFENTADAVAFTEDVDGEPVFVDVNAAFEDTFGYALEEIAGEPLSDYIIPDEQLDDIRAVREKMRTVDTFQREVRRKTSDGYREFLLHPIPVDRAEERTRIYAVYKDITERKRRERELRRYETIIENMHDGALMFDPDGVCTFANQTAVEITPRSRDELVGTRISELFGRDSVKETDQYWEYESLVNELLTGDRKQDRARITLDEPSDGIVLDVNLSRVESEDGSFLGIVGIARDITKAIEHEEQLERQNERLNEFTSIVSHDLRNPLNVAEGRLTLHQEECESEHLAEIEMVHDRMKRLIEDLLLLAREGGVIEETKPFDLSSTVERCFRTVDTADATLVNETTTIVRGDESRVQQLLENLVRNAIEHGGSAVTVTVGDLDDGFYVEDDGPGIDESERDRIFQSGYSTSSDGTGLGLDIVRQIVDAHGWEVHIASTADTDARFEITGVETVN